MHRLWKPLGSLRLTIACLAVSIILIFIGTVAQADEGLYQAQARYFKQWLVWGPLLFGHRLPILLPGGYLLGTVLVINLLTAHIRRFQWSWRKWGIHLAHLGIVVLLVGQLATDMLSLETHLRLREGESKNFAEKHRAHELVFIRGGGATSEEMVSIPESELARQREVSHERLPFRLRVKRYQINSEIYSRDAVLKAAGELSAALATVDAEYSTAESLVEQAERAGGSRGRWDVWRAALATVGETDAEDLPAAVRRLDPIQQEQLLEELKRRFHQEMRAAFRQQGGEAALAAELLAEGEPVTAESLPMEATRGYGVQALAIPLPETKQLDEANLPYTSVELEQDGQTVGTWLFSPWLGPQEIAIGETTWQAAFRPERIYHPFQITLLEATHEVYRGTDIPKNFQSRIRIEHPGKAEIREVDISMNEPLRYEGLTFFQYQMGAEELQENVGTSTLLVVRNPSWLTPYIGCIFVALGLSYHFLLHLIGFIKRRSSGLPLPDARDPAIRLEKQE